MSAPGVVVIGGGQAAASTAITLRQLGYGASITIVAEEESLPYERPPLSKGLLVDPATPVTLFDADVYDAQDITVLHGVAATAVDPLLHTVTTSDGGSLTYSALVFATGSRNRTAPWTGADLAGVHLLRTRADAEDLGRELRAGRRVVVVGGGFVGLEIASAAASVGCDVTVVEVGPQLLGRVLSQPLADVVADRHRDRGVRVLTGTRVAALDGDDHVTAVLTDHGRLEADVVVVGIGAVAEDSLAGAAGLKVDDGIVVDDHLRALGHDDIYAVGDCARFPESGSGRAIRLESVQNACDHGATVARAIAGSPAPYQDLPWFWSDQGDLKIQVAGLRLPEDQVHHLADDAGRHAVYAIREGRLVAVETLDWPGEHLAARRVLAANEFIPAAAIQNTSLSALLRARRSA